MMHFEELKEENIWKVHILEELVNVKQYKMSITFNAEKMPREEVDNMINLISTM